MGANGSFTPVKWRGCKTYQLTAIQSQGYKQVEIYTVYYGLHKQNLYLHHFLNIEYKKGKHN